MLQALLAIVHFQAKNLLQEALLSLKGCRLDSTKIAILDNSSSEEVQELARQTNCIYESYENPGYGGAFNNFFLNTQIKAQFFGFLNQDLLFPDKNWIRRLLAYCKTHPETGAIGPKLLHKDGSLHSCGLSAPTKIRGFGQKDIGQFDKIEEVFGLTGACFLTPSKLFLEIGGFDNRFFLFFEETDLFLRIREKGFKIIFFGLASVIHLFERKWTGTKSSLFSKSSKIFFEKWKNKI
jgi:GT2 family glycosyltransferase